MSGDKIAKLSPDVVISEGKQSFMDHLAQEYDRFTKSKGEPVALVFTFVTIDGAASASYMTMHCVEDRNMLYISRGLNALQSAAMDWDYARPLV